MTGWELPRRLRALGGEVGVDPADAARVAGAVRERHRRWRRARVSGVAAVVVVLLGAFAVLAGVVREDAVPAASGSPVSWPLRGDLAGDAAVLERAERVWREHPGGPEGDVRAIYAQRGWGGVEMVVVALATVDSGGVATVGWVTTAVGRDDGALRLRAVETVAPGALAVGFVLAGPEPGDAADAGTSVVGLGAPGVSGLKVRSALFPFDIQSSGGPNRFDIQVAVEPGFTSWNTQLVAEGQVVDPAPSLAAPRAHPVRTVVRGGQVYVQGLANPCDIVTTRKGIVGVVADAQGRVDTDLSTVDGQVHVAVAGTPGELTTEPDGTTRFTPRTAEGLTKHSRLRLATPAGLFHLGGLSFDDGWRLRRAADPTVPAPAYAVAPR